MSKTKKYHIIKLTIPAKDQTVTFDSETDKLFDRATEVAILTSPAYSSNRNLVLKSPLKINGEELFPEDFDTALLHPEKLGNKRYMSINEEAKGSLVEGKLVDPNAGAFPYVATIIITLKNDKKED